MKNYSIGKKFTLLCVLFISSIIFCAEPARPSLENQLAKIDAKSDVEVVCTIMPMFQHTSQLRLAESKVLLQHEAAYVRNLVKHEADCQRLELKCSALTNERDACHDAERKRTLQHELDVISSKHSAQWQKGQQYTNSLEMDENTSKFYNYQVSKSNVYKYHASLLLAQKEKLEQEKTQLKLKEAQWQEEKIQCQLREQGLLAQLKDYQRFENGPLLEGVPNAPGGPKPLIKRRGSF